MHRVFGQKEDVKYTDRQGAYLIPMKNGRIGVVQTDQGYFLLGGGIKDGESDEECIERECMEETGYRAVVKQKIGSAESYYKAGQIGFFHPIQTYYTGELLEKAQEPTEAGHRLVWMKPEGRKGSMYLEMQDWAIGEGLKMMEDDSLEIHADDFALSLHASQDILACLRAGRLDGISVLTNMSCYEECVRKFHQERKCWPKQPLLTVHLNFMEGHCLADPAKIPHLVDREGYFKISWGTLFIWNYSPKKFQTIKRELKEEIKAQTERFLEAFGRDEELRFDGHQHTQMIPLVYQALLEVIVEQRYRTGYIRVTREPVRPYLRPAGLWKTYRPVNWVKNILLNLYAPGMERALLKKRPSWQQENRPMYLWGVVMSGHMDADRVHRLLPGMQAQAAGKKRRLEILFHPGTVLKSELGKEFCNQGANHFHISEGRHEEYEAVMSLEDGQKMR